MIPNSLTMGILSFGACVTVFSVMSWLLCWYSETNIGEQENDQLNEFLFRYRNLNLVEPMSTICKSKREIFSWIKRIKQWIQKQSQIVHILLQIINGYVLHNHWCES